MMSAAVLVAGVGVSVLAAAPASAACSSASHVAGNNDTRAYVPSGSCEITEGDSGVAVIALQRALNKCYGAGLNDDGKFGSKTLSAVKSAQRKAGVNDDGRFGPRSKAAINWPYYKTRPENGNFPFWSCHKL